MKNEAARNDLFDLSYINIKTDVVFWRIYLSLSFVLLSFLTGVKLQASIMSQYHC